MPFGPAYNTIRSLATYATSSFFSRIEVVGEEHVPDSGPIISVSNHWSGAVDVSLWKVGMQGCGSGPYAGASGQPAVTGTS